jgi:glycerophosphoryl diester phosphodiesterase
MTSFSKYGIIAVLSAVSVSFLSADKTAKLNTIKVKDVKSIKEFFAYSPDRIPFVSAHRGGPLKGFPENSIATFENTLGKVHSLLEIDPHYTKDGAMVLMHDATLERTSTGHGKVIDYTLKELQELKLKDTEGNITPYPIPTLDETLEWAKGKTILVLDEKDVPMEMRVKKVQEHHAEASTIIMAYTLDDAKKCYALDKNIVMEVMLANMEKVKAFDESGVPWQNVVVFVNHALVTDPAIFNEIHKRGAMCIVGSSRNYDVKYAKGEIKSFDELSKNYNSMLQYGADIIEADLAIEAGTALKPLLSASSSKSKYFN